jgi:hypothetical protein
MSKDISNACLEKQFHKAFIHRAEINIKERV